MKQCATAVIELKKVRERVTIIDPYFMAIRLPEVFEEIGFQKELVRKCVRKYRHLRLNDGATIDAHGMSDGAILAVLAEGLGVNTSEGDRFLCTLNKIRAWRDACIARLDEIESQKNRPLWTWHNRAEQTA